MSGDERLFGLIAFVSLGAERNLPTYYSTVAILVCALLLALIGFAKRRSKNHWPLHWFLLAVVFVFLSFDENNELHERLTGPMRSLFESDGVLYYTWVIPYGIGLVLLTTAYLRFLHHIPRRTARLFIFAAALFVSGVLAMEMVGAYVYQEVGSQNILYVSVQTLEEILEMSGLVVFIFALVDYIEESIGKLQLVLGRD